MRSLTLRGTHNIDYINFGPLREYKRDQDADDSRGLGEQNDGRIDEGPELCDENQVEKNH